MRGLRRNLAPALLSVLLCVALVACTRGIPQFQLYVEAFNSQYTQGDLVLDRVAQAERIVVGKKLARGGGIPDFNPDNAAYYVTVGDPPITASLRASLNSLKAYNDALGGLASGETATALSNRVGALGANLLGAAGSLAAAASGAGAIAGAPQLIEGMTVALNRALPIVQTIATIASRESFRRQLVAAYPAMRELLLSLREGTPAMFEIMKRSYVQRGSLDGTLGISAGDLAALEKDRQMLSGWVILMDKSLSAMETAVAGALSRISPTDLAALTEASVEIKVLAEQLKAIRTAR